MKIGNAILVSILESVSIFCQNNVMEHGFIIILWRIFHIILADHYSG